MNQLMPPAVRSSETDGHTAFFVGPYRLVEKLGDGAMGLVYRAEHLRSGQSVALKTARNTRQTALASVRREAKILGQLDHPGVVRLLDEGVFQGVPWLAMELLDGPTLQDAFKLHGAVVDSQYDLMPPSTALDDVGGLRQLANRLQSDGPAGPQAAGRTIRFDLQACRPHLSILYKLCETLTYLHGEGVVHRDLKPSNIFFRSPRHPVLVDFGVVAWFEGAHSRERLGGIDRRRFAGTLQYMAPEQLRGEMVDARVDLYALGCLLYRAVSGRHPFAASTPQEIIRRHVEASYTPPQQAAPGLPDELADLIDSLLEPNADDRLGHADVAAHILARFCEAGPREEAPPCDTTRMHLNKPGFVGRKGLFDDVVAALAFDDGPPRGSHTPLVLVGGMSGAGKTRLAMELADACEEDGVTVTLSSCDAGADEDAELGQTTALWAFRGALQQIADHCREAGAAETARIVGRRGGVLAQFEPSMTDLPGHEHDPAPVALPARAARDRVTTYLTETLVAYCDQQPLLIIVDDLHHADELSLEFLHSMLRTNSLANVRILATYRNERADAVDELRAHPQVRHFELDPLDADAVSSMVADMLAMHQPPEKLVDHLVSQAAFNPYVVSEYVHAAVEEGLLERDRSGRWRVVDDFDERARGDALRLLDVTARLRSLIERRLGRLDDAQRQVIEAAAVVGPHSDRDILAALTGLQSAQLDRVLARLHHQHLVQHGAGRRVTITAAARGVAYEALDEARRRRLHYRVARLLERRGQADVDALSLVGHWRRAGAPSRELCYIEAAAEQALQRGATTSARLLLERGLTICDRLQPERPGAPGDTPTPLDLRRARLERLMARVQWASSKSRSTLELLRRSMAHANAELPSTGARWALLAAREVARQLATVALGAAPPDSRCTDSRALREALETGLGLFWPMVHQGQLAEATAVTALLANLAHRLGAADSCALPFAVLGASAEQLGFDGLADSYKLRARHNLNDELHSHDFSGTCRTFTYNALARGDRPSAEKWQQTMLRYYERAGARLGYRRVLTDVCLHHLILDDAAAAEECTRQLREFDDPGEVDAGHLWIRIIEAQLRWHRGHLDATPDLLAEIDPLVEQARDPRLRGHARAITAVLRAEIDRPTEALRDALAAADVFDDLVGRLDGSLTLYQFYQLLPRAFIACWCSAQLSTGQRHLALERARYLSARAGNLAKRMQIARAGWLRHRGLLAAVDGDVQQASRHLSQSLAAARRFDLPFEDQLTRRAAASLGDIPRAD